MHGSVFEVILPLFAHMVGASHLSPVVLPVSHQLASPHKVPSLAAGSAVQLHSLAFSALPPEFVQNGLPFVPKTVKQMEPV
jgi:hypothetical protein